MHACVFEHFDRANVIVKAGGSHDFDDCLLKRPCYKATRHFGRVALFAIFWNDIISDLNNPIFIWTSHKSYTANHTLVHFMNSDPIPDRFGWRFFHVFHKERQGFCQIRPRPMLGNIHPEHFDQPRSIIHGCLFEIQREWNEL